jgi:hypothetical protein
VNAIGYIPLDGDTWEAKYELLYNANDPQNASWQDEDGNGRMYETYGDDLQTILEVGKVLPNHIWTYIDFDGGTAVVNGYKLTNRIGHFITKNAWTNGSSVVVIVSEGE